MIDFNKPVVTSDGREVTIISTEGRLIEAGKLYPIMGYIEDQKELTAWARNGKPWNGSFQKTLKQKPVELFLAIHPNGSVGVFNTEGAAKGANAPTTVKVQYIPGQKDF